MDKQIEKLERKLSGILYGYITVTYNNSNDSIRVKVINNIEWDFILYHISDYFNKLSTDYVTDMVIRDYKNFLLKKYIKSEV